MATKETILQEMLNSVPSNLDKREGSFIYDSLAPSAEQLAETDKEIENVKTKFTVSNLTGDELTTRVNDITGIERKAATYAIGTVTVTGTGTINMGDLFETSGGIQFKATETKAIVTSGNVAVQAVVAGASGNVASSTIILFPVTLVGFTAVTNANPTTGGYDKESDADLITRYHERLQLPATAGNKAHYVAWAKEISGVGDARVVPLWNGNNTVKVIIIDSDRQPASAQLVTDVQNHLDPGVTGVGDGEAPIGAFVTVVSAAALNINVSVTVTLLAGYSLQDVTANINASFSAYLKEIAFIETFVSYAKAGNAILNSVGVSDYSGLTINTGTANISIGNEQVAVLGVLTVV